MCIRDSVTTRFRTEFDYLLRTMPDTAQREVILEIIHKHKEYLDSLESALAEDAHDAIISKGEFRQVQQLLELDTRTADVYKRQGGRWSVLDRLHIKQAERRQKDNAPQQEQERSRKS